MPCTFYQITEKNKNGYFEIKQRLVEMSLVEASNIKTHLFCRVQFLIRRQILRITQGCTRTGNNGNLKKSQTNIFSTKISAGASLIRGELRCEGIIHYLKNISFYHFILSLYYKYKFIILQQFLLFPLAFSCKFSNLRRKNCM